ncbi:MAG TPA: AAA family ATPase [Nanoarchaeota archaeon]|nr:AAA family ATPase [Nanoarchaeota archaeon]
MKIRKKLPIIHDYIINSYYVNDRNIKFWENSFNDVIFFSLITGLINGKELILGNPGLGKTTVAEAAVATIYGYEPGFVQNCELNGQRDLTEEKMFGRPHLGELNKGNEKVIWRNFAKSPCPKIVDEINRMPEGAQNILLNSIDRGVFKYLNEVLYFQGPFYATANYPDRGTYTLIPPLVDRFNICVECVPCLYSSIFYDSIEKNKELLRDEKIKREMIKSLEEDDFKRLEELRQEYKAKLEERGIPTIDDEEISQFMESYKNIKFDGEAELSLAVFFADVNSIIKTPEDVTSYLTENYKNSPTGMIKNNLSYRFLKSVKDYSKAVAHVLGEEYVDTEVLRKILPYALAHRIEVDDEYIHKNIRPEFYPGSQKKYIAEVIVNEFFKDYGEKRDVYREYFNALLTNDEETRKKLAYQYDLPVIRGIEYRKEKSDIT